MANHISHASLPYPIFNARYTILVPYLDADGDPTDPTTPDTEVSQDAGAFADATEEVTTITGSNGTGYITLTAQETDCSAVAVAFKVASGPKATLVTLYPRRLPILESGTASAGAANTITLASGTYTGLNLSGCFVRTTGGTGGGTTANQARRIISYNTGTRVATVAPDWETNPDNTTTYDILLPEGVLVPMLTALPPTTLGRTLDVSSGGEAGVDWANVGSPTTTVNLSGTSTKALEPTTAGRTLDVTAAGNAGIDWNNIENPTTSVDLSGTTLKSIRSNTLAAGSTSTTAVLDASASSSDDFYNGSWLWITTGSGAGQVRLIKDYVGSTKTCTVDAWVTTPGEHDYIILPSNTVNANVIQWLGTACATPTVAGVPEVDVTHLDGDSSAARSLKKIFDGSGADVTIGTLTVTTNAMAWNASWDAEVQSEVQDAIEVNNLDHLVKSAVDTDFATTVHLNSVIGHLADNGTSATFDRTTDSLEAIYNSIDAVPTTTEIATAVWGEAQEGGYTARQIHELTAAVMYGILSGMDTGTPVFKGLDGTTNRVTATVDSYGNRSGFTITPRAV